MSRPPFSLIALSVVALVLASIPTACSVTKGKPKAAGGRYVVTAPHAPFYKYGPAQSFGPDFVLNRGQKVTMIDVSFGFSHVMTDDGVAGYVGLDQLAPAPPEPTTPKPAPVNDRVAPTAGGKGKRSNLQPTPGSPLFDVRDVPMPLPEPDAPKPRFRY